MYSLWEHLQSWIERGQKIASLIPPDRFTLPENGSIPFPACLSSGDTTQRDDHFKSPASGSLSRCPGISPGMPGNG